MKKKIKFLIIVVCIAVIIAIGFGIAVRDYINPFYVVASGSMVPTLNIGDLVIVNHDNSSSSFNNLKIGDIIVFKMPGINEMGQHITIVHRVAQILSLKRVDNGETFRVVRTKGDANPISIPLLDYPIREQNYIGKVVYVIPKVGLINLATGRPISYMSIGLIAIVLVLYFRKILKEKEKNQ